jgi:hypothetical protein
MNRLRLMRLPLVAAVLFAAALVTAPVSVATVAPPQTPTVQATPAPNELVTVATIDPATGNVTARWTGPQSQRDQEVAAQRAAVGAPSPTAPPSRGLTPLISRHSPCTANTGYFEVWNYPPLVCFANSGGTSVTLYSVYEFYTGNNVGGVHWLCGGGVCDSGYWPKWSSVVFGSPLPTVNYVYIQ